LIAQLVEQRTENPRVSGSIPLQATIQHMGLLILLYGEVAQLARAFGSYPTGRGFESPPRYHRKITVNSLYLRIQAILLLFILF
jgi:hypothetical protein